MGKKIRIRIKIGLISFKQTKMYDLRFDFLGRNMTFLKKEKL